MIKFPPLLFKPLAVLGITVGLAACGGGGGSPAPIAVVPPPPPAATGPVWTAGKFDPSANFEKQCAAPRAGTNDRAGTTTLENFWLRSWSDETYLWFSEIADRDPATFSNRLAYFDVLRTTATTASGTAKDQFHFNIPTDEYEQLVNSGASAGYGIKFALINRTVPRDIRVAFIQPSSPASGANILRGAEILEVDGVDVVNGNTQSDVNTLNAALFPGNAAESHTFKIREVGSTATRTVTLVSAIVTQQPVNVSKVIDTQTGKVGYIHFTTFGTTSAEEQIHDAITSLKNQGVSDLVLDLRYNGGGFLDIAGELGFMIAGDARTNGRIFDKLTFSSKHPVTNPVTGQTITPTPFHKTGQGFSINNGVALNTLNLPRVFLLSTDGTCSASEAVINSLRGIDVEVILIGTKTCGKPYGFYATDNCGETYFTIQFSGSNDKGFGDYADGFTPMNDTSAIGEKIPGCLVGDDFSKPLGDTGENMLEVALSYRENGTCPTGIPKPSAQKRSYVGDPATALLNEPRLQMRELLRTSRIENAPRNRGQ